MTFLQTMTGQMVDVTRVQVGQVDLAEIAVVLARTARFNGHTLRFYSIAEHSIVVARSLVHAKARPAVVAWGLLHDAHEWLIGDIARPVTQALEVLHPGTAKVVHHLKHTIDLTICAAIGFNMELLDDDELQLVHDIDAAVLFAERDVLMVSPPEPWPGEFDERPDVRAPLIADTHDERRVAEEWLAWLACTGGGGVLSDLALAAHRRVAALAAAHGSSRAASLSHRRIAT
jgi:hypothetical protein